MVFLDCPATPTAAILQTVQEIWLKKYVLSKGDGKPVEEADPGYENEKDGGGKMNIQEENLGIKKRGKKVVWTFDLSVPVKTRREYNLDLD